MTRTAAFPADPTSVAAARRFVTETLVELPVETLAVVQMMVSELATNAVQHVQAGFDLAIHSSRRQVRVDVTDRGGGVPRLQQAAPDDLRGRGLKIVDMLATNWGVDQGTEPEKTVWFTVTLRPNTAPVAQPV